MPKITELSALTTPANNDDIAIVDNDEASTKKISREDFLTGSPLPADTVDTQSITDANVTTAKLADASVTNAKLATGAGEPGDWTTWTPTLTNVTTGNGTLTASYTRIGNTVFAKGSFTLGTTSSISGVITISLPVTAATMSTEDIIGQGRALDAGTALYPLFAQYQTSTTMRMVVLATFSGANPVYTDITGTRQISNTTPFTFGNTDRFQWIITYEAA